ncbi:GNAT family N-acetyltransferase [bacterium]|nr:GNAT family N-acetyltransferase [bacterium]
MDYRFLIRPIYDQDPDIWRQFVVLINTCLGQTFSHQLNPAEQRTVFAKFQDAWEKYPFNFAFGAYDTDAADRLVGFVHGQYEGPHVTITALYVHPEFQDRGLGSSLLSHAEVAASLQASRLDLVPATGKSAQFYRNRGYTRLPGECECFLSKDLMRMPAAVRYAAFRRTRGA